MKIKSLLIGSVLLLTVLLGFFYINLQNKSEFKRSRREIVMRKIGHEVLLYAGDSSSRVLPVTQLPNEKYRLAFSNPITFNPDTLSKIVRRAMRANEERPDYIVKVLDCPQTSIVYGYAISGQAENNIMACSGRKQPVGCYVIAVEFGDLPLQTQKKVTAFSVAVLLVFCPLLLWRLRSRERTTKAQISTRADASTTIGAVRFDPQQKLLACKGEVIKLTAKESKILSVFAQSPNQVIDRARLQKEIWEDDGIIVGRSLDVFISKLRKKLECDAQVQLVNIHGKGYKLQIESA